MVFVFGHALLLEKLCTGIFLELEIVCLPDLATNKLESTIIESNSMPWLFGKYQNDIQKQTYQRTNERTTE